MAVSPATIRASGSTDGPPRYRKQVAMIPRARPMTARGGVVRLLLTQLAVATFSSSSTGAPLLVALGAAERLCRAVIENPGRVSPGSNARASSSVLPLGLLSKYLRMARSSSALARQACRVSKRGSRPLLPGAYGSCLTRLLDLSLPEGVSLRGRANDSHPVAALR